MRKRISAWGCGAVTLAVWLLSLALAAPPSFYTLYVDLRPSGIDLVVCEEFWPKNSNLRLLYSCFILIASYMVPLLSVSVSYCAITISLKRYSVPGEPSRSQQQWSQKRKRTFSLLVASVLAFALCWLPLQVSHFRPNEKKNEIKRAVMHHYPQKIICPAIFFLCKINITSLMSHAKLQQIRMALCY